MQEGKKKGRRLMLRKKKKTLDGCVVGGLPREC